MRGVGPWFVLLFWIVTACQAPVRRSDTVTIEVLVDGETRAVTAIAGMPVEQALREAGIALGPLDRLEPPGYTLVREGLRVEVIRVEEDFLQVEEILPFERRILRNEALPEGESRLVQRGVNGLQRVTYRILRENGQEVSRQVVKVEVLREAVPEIVMIGVRQPLVARPLPGRLAYLAGGNAWVLEGNTGARRLVVVTGDLDGRVFRLSPDGRWLLFTRQAPEEEMLNTLWVVDLDAPTPQPAPLAGKNIVHFAAFAPEARWLVAYSTVEPRPGPPGWQANNDLYLQRLTERGPVPAQQVIEPRAGGIYGWWGTTYAWHPRGESLAYAQPDQIGVVNLEDQELVSWLDFTPYRAEGNWAWLPGIAWSPLGDVLFAVWHGQPDREIPEDEPVFHLVALAPEYWEGPLVLAENVGMFAHPIPSPVRLLPTGERAYWVAYLQALFPQQSETSRYRLMLMDRDGSNKRALFPPPGEVGLALQEVRWSPGPVDDEEWAIAFVYQGNLFLVLVPSGELFQLTGDGLVTALDWR